MNRRGTVLTTVAVTLGVVVLLAAVAAGGWWFTHRSDSAATVEHKLAGTMTNSRALGTYGGSANSDADHLSELIAGKTFSCADGAGGDYRAGTSVVVSDESNKIIATGHLEGGTQSLAGCTLRFTLVLPDAKTYQVTVGSTGPYVISGADLAAQGWSLDLKV